MRSRRRCALCFGLNGDDAEKKGQIAHVDQDNQKNAEEDLVFLCLEHHDEYDSKTSQSKGLTVQEVRGYREELYSAMSARSPGFRGDLLVEARSYLFRSTTEIGAALEVGIDLFCTLPVSTRSVSLHLGEKVVEPHHHGIRRI